MEFTIPKNKSGNKSLWKEGSMPLIISLILFGCSLGQEKRNFPISEVYGPFSKVVDKGEVQCLIDPLLETLALTGTKNLSEIQGDGLRLTAHIPFQGALIFDWRIKEKSISFTGVVFSGRGVRSIWEGSPQAREFTLNWKRVIRKGWMKKLFYRKSLSGKESFSSEENLGILVAQNGDNFSSDDDDYAIVEVKKGEAYKAFFVSPLYLFSSDAPKSWLIKRRALSFFLKLFKIKWDIYKGFSDSLFEW